MGPRRLAAAAAVLALVASACGQKPGVHERAVRLAGGEGIGNAGLGVDGSGTSGTGTSGTGAAGGSGAGGSSGGGSGTGSGSTGSGVPTGGDATGVTSTSITIGIHAPLAGAAPLKNESFQKGKDLYWLRGSGPDVKIYGRTVKVVFADDHYNPTHARSVCQTMAEQQHAMLLVGGGGTDQIQACAQYAASKGIPTSRRG